MTTNSVKGRTSGRFTPPWAFFSPALAALGIVAIVIYAFQSSIKSPLGVIGAAVAVSGASAMVGGVIGFLFGIPGTRQATDGPGSPRLRPNTNLKEVSDWLTKIILGVGLVQLGRALPALSKLAKNLKAPLGGQASSPAFGLGLVIFYTLLGFLFLYLWTWERLPLEAQALDTEIQQQISRSDSGRSNALDLIDQQLNASRGGVQPPQSALDKAVSEAPNSTRLLIFMQADQERRELARGIRKAGDGHPDADWYQRQIKLTIPVFRALIAADTHDQYHRNHGSLGWALKDSAGPVNQDRPTWAEAVSELTKAIEIRDNRQISGWRLYEANRAVCNIKLFRSLPPGDSQAAGLAAQIETDLAAARSDRFAASMADPASGLADPDIKQWRQDHPLS